MSEIHYIITKLKNFKLGDKPPLLPEIYLKQVFSLSDQNFLHDMKLLANMQNKGVPIDVYDDLGFYKKKKEIFDGRTLWQQIQEKALSPFLQNIAKEYINVFEISAALLAKNRDIPKNIYLAEISNATDSAAKLIRKNFDLPDLASEHRYSFYKDLKSALYENDPFTFEMTQAKILERFITFYTTKEIFSYDTLFGYFLRLILTEKLFSMKKENGIAVFKKIDDFIFGISL